MKKAFVISGGAGRVMCAIPALERYAQKHDDFVIVAEGWMEVFSGSPLLRDKVFHVMHNRLFEEHLKDCEIITPEPYRFNPYFNQKCNLIQAFDMIINELDEVPHTDKITMELSKKEQIDGHGIVQEVRSVMGKEKVIVFQPFGSGVTQTTNFLYDTSGRSFELLDITRLIEELKKDYGIILMSQYPIDADNKLGIAWPQNTGIRDWMGIINAADYFLGCDSLGQHIAYSLNKPATVVIGSTFPENISYPDVNNFDVIDVGGEKRKYAPFRITHDDNIERNNEGLMVLNDDQFKQIVNSVKQRLTTTVDVKTKLEAKK